MPKFNTGDRVAYTAKFAKMMGGYAIAQRRGTFVSLEKTCPTSHARVKWDDFESMAPRLAEQYGEDYVEDAREFGQMVALDSICKPRSAKFGDTYA